MKEYPKIFPFNDVCEGMPCVAFYKYDGSNLRFEYSRKQKKWQKFGTRRHLFSVGDPEYGAAVPVFYEKYAEGLAKVFHDTKSWRSSDNMTVYAEYFGPNSFAGRHEPSDPKDLMLFDVSVHRRGILGPQEFLDLFHHLPIAEVVYTGPLTKEYFLQVRNSDKLIEGVICKGGSSHSWWACKIKTNAYLKKLKEKYLDRWRDFWEE